MGRSTLVLCILVELCCLNKAWSNALNDTIPAIPQNSVQDTNSPLSQIKNLRQEGKLDEAKQMAVQYLASHPNDVDVRLLLGLIYLQQENFAEADSNLTIVLSAHPTYTDARVALVRAKIAEKQDEEAKTLINDGLKQNPNDQDLLSLKANLEKSEATPAQPSEPVSVTEPTVSIKKTSADSTSLRKEIQKLRSEGKITQAKAKATDWLKSYPDDVDVKLLLGLIEIQQGNSEQAKVDLQSVLSHDPNYLDARLGLIKINLQEKNYTAAQNLIEEGLKISPNNPDLLDYQKKANPTEEKNSVEKKASKYYKKSYHRSPQLSEHDRQILEIKKYMEQRNFSKAKALSLYLLSRNPLDTEARIKLAEIYMARYRDAKALQIINQGLRRDPYNVRLLNKQGEIRYILRYYALAANSFQRVLILDANNKVAKGYLSDIASLTPNFLYGLNEIGIMSDNAYVQDLHSVWDYSSLFYKRNTDYGTIIGQVNYASRLHQNAPQFLINYLPQLNRDLYLDLAAAFANEPALFPKEMVAGEAYLNLPKHFQVSAGAKYSNIGPTYFSTYTGSLNWYPGNNWLAFRPYFYVPKSSNIFLPNARSVNSVLYTALIQHYFSTIDHYIRLSAGSGRSPDLADLLTVNFIVIKNNFVNLNYEFPICNHHIIVDLGIGYSKWEYPSSLVRNLYNGNIGFKYRF